MGLIDINIYDEYIIFYLINYNIHLDINLNNLDFFANKKKTRTL